MKLDFKAFCKALSLQYPKGVGKDNLYKTYKSAQFYQRYIVSEFEDPWDWYLGFMRFILKYFKAKRIK